MKSPGRSPPSRRKVRLGEKVDLNPAGIISKAILAKGNFGDVYDLMLGQIIPDFVYGCSETLYLFIYFFFFFFFFFCSFSGRGFLVLSLFSNL
jgi:hypothetical protein